jgi:hypothetical protein
MRTTFRVNYIDCFFLGSTLETLRWSYSDANLNTRSIMTSASATGGTSGDKVKKAPETRQCLCPVAVWVL